MNIIEKPEVHAYISISYPNRIMQNEKVIALSPIVADALVLLKDEGVDAQLAKSGGNNET